MSDLGRGDVPIGSAMSSRPQNGGSRTAQSAGPTPTDPPRYRTPTDVMRERRAREARRQEEAERQRRLQEEAVSAQEETVTGGGDAQEQRSSRVRSQPATRTTQSYDIGGSDTLTGVTASRPGRQENVPPISGDTRGGSTQEQRQARPVDVQHAAPQAYEIGGIRGSQDASTKQRARTEAYETLNIPASSRLPPQQQSSTAPPKPESVQQTERTRFPHAFERWETLSSHWEGLTSYWIRRLQENSNELGGKPIDQQMARQVSDLSAAGANLFHAVVELQRLRASSERKFQRWFNEFRDEQEQSRERQAELERLLRDERQEKQERQERQTQTQSSSSIDAIRAEKNKADELVREMRRELQISKEEARRAWEELGRREQEERERTIALRSGEPTVIGGVQVVPMQGLPSRGGSTATAQRPVTRDGPYPGGPGNIAIGGQQFAQQAASQNTSLESPGDEQRQFTFRPASSSPAGTDPFTEQSGRPEQQPMRHEPDNRFYASPSRSTQPATSAAAMAQARTPTAPHPQSQTIPTTDGTPERFYQQHIVEPVYQPPFSSSTSGPSTAIHAPQRPGTGGTEPSYVPSVRSGNGSSIGEEEYHINPDGSWTLDRHGRRIPYGLPIGSSPQRQIEPEQSDDDEEDYDPRAVMERERAYQQRYGSSQAAQSTSGNVPRTTSSNQPATRALFHEQVTANPTATPPTNVEQDYSGDEYGPQPPTGWENIQEVTARHRHPTRLSDIVEIEERSGMTSPSRTSYAGGGRGSGAEAGSEHAPALPPSGLGLNVATAQGRSR